VRTVFNLEHFYLDDLDTIEIGADEAGRGPLFGRVYSAAVILPKDNSFDHFKMKDSKKFHSKQKINDVAQYIKDNAIAWAVSYEDENTIDEINILQATQRSMHKCITEVLQQTKTTIQPEVIQLLIDGNCTDRNLPSLFLELSFKKLLILSALLFLEAICKSEIKTVL